MTGDPAKGRFIVIAVLRLSGTALALFGIAVIARHLIEPANVVGALFLAIGVLEATIVPLALASRWRTPDA